MEVADEGREFTCIGELKGGEIVCFVLGAHDGWQVAAAHEDVIDEQAGDTAIAVIEGMNQDEVVMKLRRERDGMEGWLLQLHGGFLHGWKALLLKIWN